MADDSEDYSFIKSHVNKQLGIEDDNNTYKLDLLIFMIEYLDELRNYDTTQFNKKSLRKYRRQLKKIQRHLKKVDKSLISIKDTNIKLFVGVGAGANEKLILLNLLKLLEIHLLLKIFSEV